MFFNRIEKSVVTGGPGHGLEVNVRVEAIENPEHVFRAVLVDEVDGPGAAELRMARIEPCSNLVRGVVVAQAANHVMQV